MNAQFGDAQEDQAKITGKSLQWNPRGKTPRERPIMMWLLLRYKKYGRLLHRRDIISVAKIIIQPRRYGKVNMTFFGC